MTTTSVIRPARSSSQGRPGSLRRVVSLARAEALLLRRSPIALLTALVSPAAMVLFVKTSLPPESSAGFGGGAVLVTSMAGYTLLFVVYYNLVSALVSRREELVLKRLRTGEASDAEILAGTVTPAVAVAWSQILVVVALAGTVMDLGYPTNPILVLAAVVMGTATFVLLAAASSAAARSVQMAELTTTPVLVASMLLSGMMFPLDQLPEPVQALAQVLPLTPVVDLVRLGLTGTTPTGATVDLAGSFGAALAPGAVLAAWLVAAALAMRCWFRWEPRR